jgi:hypothetical protein
LRMLLPSLKATLQLEECTSTYHMNASHSQIITSNSNENSEK